MPPELPPNTGSAWIAVHAAANHKDWDTLIKLQKSGASIDTRDDEGNTALGTACRQGDAEAVRKLIQMGASVEAANDAGETPLMAAGAAEQSEIVQVLLKAGANVKTRTPASGHTALHWTLARPHGNDEKIAAIVRMLLQAGAEINQPSRSGMTPLMHAAWFGHAQAAAVLLEHGADPKLGDNQGRKALELCKERGHLDICRLIESGIEKSRQQKKESLGQKFARWWKG